MKLINFADRSCEIYRKRLDAYLSNELTEETRAETLRHLEGCSRCARELEIKQRLKDALRHAVSRDEPAPEELRQRVLQQFDPRLRRTGWDHWWLAVAAMIVLSVGGIGMWRWLSARRASEISFHAGGLAGASGRISDNNAEVFNIGMGDHVHCALHRDFSSGPRSFERMARDLGPDYIGLVPLAQARAPQDYTVMVGHRCDYKGRNFIHLILTNQKTILSIILTKKNGEAFDKSALATVLQSSDAPLYRARLQDQEIVGFETRDYLAYVVSGLPQEDHFQLASGLTPSVRDFLAKLES
jgi:anti-sigma factor (TIGR02949 family)